MANENGDIELIITLDDGSVLKGLASAEKASKRSGEKIERNLSRGLKNSFLSVGSAAAAGLAVAAAAAVGIFAKGIANATIKEDAVNDLNAALGRSGIFTKQASKDFQEFAAELQKNSDLADVVILKNAAVLQSLGDLSTDGLKQATQASVDLSAALGIDLSSAVNLVGKAAAGEIGSFSRYGLVIERGANNSETFSNALQKINAQFGGAAAAKTKTFSGALQQASNSFGALIEEIGMLITKSPQITAIFSSSGNFIEGLSKRILNFRKSGGFSALILDAIEFGKTVNALVIKPFEVALNVINTARLAISAAIQLFIASFATSIDFVAQGLNAVLSLFGKNIDNIAATTKMAAESTTETFASLATEAGTSLVNTFDTSSSQAADAFLNNLQRIAQDAPPITENIKNQVKEDIKEIELNLVSLGSAISRSFTKTEVTVASLAAQIRDGLGKGIANAFAALGGALAKGENGFSAFTKTVLSSLGDIAIQIGTVLIAAGLGWSLIPGFQASSGAIAQGIALTVIGGALKSFAGSSGGADASAGGAPATAGGGVQASTANEDFAPNENIEDEIEPRGPQVTLNVQGNIFDRKETGLELAQIISEAVGGNGVVFNT